MVPRLSIKPVPKEDLKTFSLKMDWTRIALWETVFTFRGDDLIDRRNCRLTGGHLGEDGFSPVIILWPDPPNSVWFCHWGFLALVPASLGPRGVLLKVRTLPPAAGLPASWQGLQRKRCWRKTWTGYLLLSSSIKSLCHLGLLDTAIVSRLQIVLKQEQISIWLSW